MNRWMVALCVVVGFGAGCGGRQASPYEANWPSLAWNQAHESALAASWTGQPQAALQSLLGQPRPDGVVERRARAAATRRLAFAADGVALPQFDDLQTTSDDAWERWLLVDASEELRRASALAADASSPPPQHAFSPPMWRVLGPVSSLDAALLSSPAPGAEPLPERIELPAADVPRRRVHDNGHGARLAGGPGTWFAESYASFPMATEVVVAVRSPGAWRLWLNDQLVLERTLAERYLPEAEVALVRVSAGSYRLRMELGADGVVASDVRLIPLGAEPGPEWLPEPVEPSGRVRAPTPVPLWPDESRRFAWADAAELVIFAADADTAVPLSALASDDQFAEARLAAAVRSLAGELRAYPPTMRQDVANDALGRLTRLHPDDAEVRATMVLELLDSGLVDEAERELSSLAGRADLPASAHLARAEYHAARGQDELERRALEAAAMAGADSCSLRARLLEVWSYAGQVQDPALLPAEWFACDAVIEWAVRSFWLPAGELEQARRWAATLLVRRPADRGIAWLVADIAAAQQDGAGVLAALQHEAAWGTEPDLPAWEHIDRTAAWGGVGPAVELVAERRARLPWQIELARAESWLSSEQLFADDRIDGRAFVDAYLADEPGYGGDVVYVLDYSKMRIFEDGSWYEVVHQIFQPMTRDAIGALGEQGIPSDALLLQARTLKRDGRTFVAPDIAGKDSISMPYLEVGDFIEIEWVRGVGPGVPERLSLLGSRFYFQVGDGVLHHTEAVYEYPAELDARVTFDLRNFAGEQVREETADGTVRASFRMMGTLPPRPEPRSAPGDEWLPSVRVAIGADDAAVVERYRNLVESRTVADRSVYDVAMQLALSGRPAAACRDARRIFRYVNDEVIGLGGFFTDPPPWVVHAGEGERLSLTWALLREAGLEPDLFFILPIDGDSTEGVPLDPNVYELTAIRVRHRGGECWMEPEWENQPFDFLRPEAQGQPALAVAGPAAGERIVTPRWPASSMRSTIELDVRVDAEGNAVVEGREMLPMQSWSGIRSFAEEVPDLDEVAREFEAALSRSFPSVEMEHVGFDGLEDPDAPVIVEYRFETTGLARQGADGVWVIDTSIYERPLASSYASLASRNTTMVLALPHDEDLLVRFELPEGASAIGVPQSQTLEVAGNRFERTWDISGTAVSLRRSARIGAQRIAPSDYGPFAEFARAAEAGGRIRIRWESP